MTQEHAAALSDFFEERLQGGGRFDGRNIDDPGYDAYRIVADAADALLRAEELANLQDQHAGNPKPFDAAEQRWLRDLLVKPLWDLKEEVEKLKDVVGILETRVNAHAQTINQLRQTVYAADLVAAEGKAS